MTPCGKHWANLHFAKYFDVAGEAVVEGSDCTQTHLSACLLLTTCHRQRIKPEFHAIKITLLCNYLLPWRILCITCFNFFNSLLILNEVLCNIKSLNMHTTNMYGSKRILKNCNYNHWTELDFVVRCESFYLCSLNCSSPVTLQWRRLPSPHAAAARLVCILILFFFI